MPVVHGSNGRFVGSSLAARTATGKSVGAYRKSQSAIEGKVAARFAQRFGASAKTRFSALSAKRSTAAHNIANSAARGTAKSSAVINRSLSAFGQHRKISIASNKARRG